MIKVVNHDNFHSEVYSHLPLGVYHRPIMAGTYTVEVSAPCYQTSTFTVTTRPGMSTMVNVELQPQVVAPVAFDQYVFAGMQTTVVALSQNDVYWYDSDTASQALAVGSYYITPVLYDTTTYYLEERYEEDTLLCVSPRSTVTVFVLDTALSVAGNDVISDLRIYPNPTENYLMVVAGDVISIVEVYDAAGKMVLRRNVSSPAKLDVSSLRSGVYFLRVEHTDGKYSCVKFVKTQNHTSVQ